MTTDRKILITTLQRRTSCRGNEYLSGFLGKARVVGLKGKPMPDGTPTWDIYVRPEPRSRTASTSQTGVQRPALKSDLGGGL